MVEAAIDALNRHDPDAMFVYLADLDSAGHEHGFHPRVGAYVAELEQIDGQIGRVLAALRRRPAYPREDWLILVGTDHGGTIDGSHGRNIDLHRSVPFIASGPSAARGRLYTTTNIVDVAATALAHLGVDLDPGWGLDGRPVGLASRTSLGVNLIFNGDAEHSTGYTDAGGNAGIAGWTDTGAMTVVCYGSPQGFPRLDDPGPPDRGRNFFCGGKTAESEIRQVIDVADLAPAIDGGLVTYELSGWFGGYLDQRDLASLTARFLDEGGGELDRVEVGPVTLQERRAEIGGQGDGLTGLLLRSARGPVPAGARRISLILFAETAAGDNDGYADALSLVLRPGG
jgi:hypothetical protein